MFMEKKIYTSSRYIELWWMNEMALLLTALGYISRRALKHLQTSQVFLGKPPLSHGSNNSAQQLLSF